MSAGDRFFALAALQRLPRLGIWLSRAEVLLQALRSFLQVKIRLGEETQQIQAAPHEDRYSRSQSQVPF